MVVVSAPGKLILFGEHFVVYGLPAIAAALEARTKAEVSKAREYTLVDERPETPGYKKEKYEQQQGSLKRIFRALGVDESQVKIVLGGELVAASGIGASAASCSAIAAALNEEFTLGLDKIKINEAAFEGEKGYHGTPSGIDNSCSTFGGFIWFKKDVEGGKSLIEPINSKMSLSIVIGNTGITSNTKNVVDSVRQDKEKHPEKFKRIFNDYSKIAEEAKSALENGDLNKLGQLMNANHALLKQINVSSLELEQLIEIALNNNALGAKLTGTGRGGLMIALVTDESKDKVVSAIEKAGFKSEITRIGAEGVKVMR